MRVGVEVGGTFTDLVAVEGGRLVALSYLTGTQVYSLATGELLSYQAEGETPSRSAVTYPASGSPPPSAASPSRKALESTGSPARRPSPEKPSRKRNGESQLNSSNVTFEAFPTRSVARTSTLIFWLSSQAVGVDTAGGVVSWQLLGDGGGRRLVRLHRFDPHPGAVVGFAAGILLIVRPEATMGGARQRIAGSSRRYRNLPMRREPAGVVCSWS